MGTFSFSHHYITVFPRISWLVSHSAYIALSKWLHSLTVNHYHIPVRMTHIQNTHTEAGGNLMQWALVGVQNSHFGRQSTVSYKDKHSCCTVHLVCSFTFTQQGWKLASTQRHVLGCLYSIYNSPNLIAINISFSKWMNKENVIHWVYLMYIEIEYSPLRRSELASYERHRRKWNVHY